MNRLGVLLLILGLIFPAAAGAQVEGAWGLGVLADYDLPAFKLNNWFPSGGLKAGAVALYVVNQNWTAEVEGHYAKYGGGELEKRTFVWSVDGKAYASPQAQSEMVWASGALNWLRHFHGSKLGKGGAAPYFLVGAGFFRYQNKISGLIWPVQKTRPLNTSLLMEPVADRQVALGMNLGLGVEYFVSGQVAIDVRGQYSLILGNVRPMEAWGLGEVFPFQKLNVGVRFKFYRQN